VLEPRAARPWQAPVRLEIDGLALAAGARTLLSGLSATLAAGERWVVLGPNGAGKSTLIAALAGLLQPAAGTLRLQSCALADWSAAALAGWRAWCPASWSDPFPLRVDEALRSVAQAHAPGRDAAEARLGQLLGALDLEALAGHDVGRLSSGERQRVAIAAALMQDAPLLLLDEPSAHLDYAHRQMLAAALESHAARGGLVVASLHELDLAWSLATHALLLQGPAGPPGRAALGGADVPDGGLRVWAGPREAVMTPARLSRVYGVPVAEVEVCGERRFWVGPRRAESA
jgi:ABC-type cobalamin/Fe3+-siderophores transport system ATPase subunit